LAVVSLISEGRLSLKTTARSKLGSDLPLVDDAVTLEDLLAHQSGIGDYVDEDVASDINDYVLRVPAQHLDSTEAYLDVLGGKVSKFPVGERFSYCNSGFVILALIAERVTGVPFGTVVQERVCRPAAMARTAFLRSDELPGTAAVGYLGVRGDRTNVFHLPVLGSGDGGLYSTIGDLRALWTAMFAGRVVSDHWVSAMVRPRSEVPTGTARYGLGFWLHATSLVVVLEGYDASVSFRSVHHPEAQLTHTTISNTSDGAWPITRHLDELYPS
jgi:CubicO group peptidase (beta-lactamase class C family)